MASQGEHSGQNLSRNVEMARSPIESAPADGQTATLWDDSIRQGVLQISGLVIKTKTNPNRADDRPRYTKEEIERYLSNVRLFLLYLEHEKEPSPTLKNQGVDQALKYILGPDMEALKKMAPDLVMQAKRVLDKYEADEWGADFTQHQGEESEEEDLGTVVATSSPEIMPNSGSNIPVRTAQIQLPPISHPIWGREGIMHGVALRTKKKKTPCLDPRYLCEKGNPKTFGHNGHRPGTWWAYMMAALFHGAHGSPQAGITGRAKFGAYSVVVSANSVYRDLNEDEGTWLWYSADKSTKNTNPLRVEISSETRSLEESLSNGKPVRVLRKAGNTSDARRNRIYPAVGIRYDGLYKVVDQKTDNNKYGGAIKKFKLVRLPDSKNEGVSWEEVQKYPTKEQLRQYDQAKEGY